MDKLRKYICLTDEIHFDDKYDLYCIISPNFIRAINACKEKKLRYIVLEDCWSTPQDIRRDKKYLESIKQSLLEILSLDLNEYHHTNYSHSEWSIVLNAWLDNYISSMWEKYCRVRKFAELGIDGMSLGNKDGCLIALDYSDFEDRTRIDSNLNLAMYYDIIHGMGVPVSFDQHDATVSKVESERKKKITLGYFKFIIYRYILLFFMFFCGSRTKVITHECYLPLNFLLAIQNRTFGKILNVDYDYLRFERYTGKGNIDICWRMQYDDTLCDDEFLNILRHNLRKYIPVAYVENRISLYNAQKKWFGRLINVKNILYAAGGVMYDEVFKYYLMEVKHKKNDVILRDIQHGGNYGVDMTMGMSGEYAVSDYIYTWGWNSKNIRSQTIRMPSAKLLNLKIPLKSDGTILFVGYELYKNYIHIDFLPVFFHRRLEEDFLFIGKQCKRFKKKFVVRFPPDEYGWDIRHHLEKMDGVVFDTIESFYDSISRAELVICSIWNTTVLESFFADVPTVVIKCIDEFEEDFRSDALEMKKHGLLFESYQELDYWLSTLTDDASIVSWWSNPKRQEYIKKFKDKFVFMPENAEAIWQNEFDKMC